MSAVVEAAVAVALFLAVGVDTEETMMLELAMELGTGGCRGETA